MAEIAVIGAGIIGLTTAIRLTESGHKVRIVAEHFTPDTTSDGAAALWEPVFVEPRDKAGPWARATLAVLQLHAGNPDCGVFPLTTYHLTASPEKPWWADMVECGHQTVVTPAGISRPCFYARSYVADMSLYVPWLYAQARGQGVIFEQGKVTGLSDFKGPAVICAGHGARDLMKDDELKPVRGVVLVYDGQLTAHAWEDPMVADGLVYIIPRVNQTIIGGSYEPGADPDAIPESLAAAIRGNAAKLLPVVAEREPRKIWAGLRPVRSSVRLEKLDGTEYPVICNYGHGGAGMTLSWGCADEVVRLLADS